jgi:hypothetical protein
MSEMVRCQCGAQFSARALSGNPRTACPVCRASLGVVAVASAIAAPSVRQESSSPTVPAEAPEAARPIPATLVVSKPRLPEVVRNWIPPATLRNHDGAKPSTPRRFLWGPPSNIGEILSADSNVPESGRPSFLLSFLLRSVIAFIVGLAGYLLFASGLVFPVQDELSSLRIALLRLYVFLAGWWTFSGWPDPPRCTYLGADGAACLTGSGWRSEKLAGAQILVFKEATALFVTKLRNPYGRRNDFRFRWHRSIFEAPVLAVSGNHSSKQELPDSDHLYHFGLRVEEAWTRRLISEMNEDWTAGRVLSFPCRGYLWKQALPNVVALDDCQEIRLTTTGLLIIDRGRTLAVMYPNIMDVQFDGRILSMHLHGSQWTGMRKEFRIRYQDLGNAQVFWHFLSLGMAGKR